MIYESMSILRSELEQYIKLSTQSESTDAEVVLGDISLANSNNGTNIKDKVVLSVVKLEEESSLKNGPTRIPEGARYKVENRPVHTNLYLLIAANYPEKYSNALKRISSVIKFFQGKLQFSLADSPVAELESSSDVNELKITVELLSPSFEQLNHIWGMLGGKSMPCALYKIRVLTLRRDAPIGYDTPIEHILINE